MAKRNNFYIFCKAFKNTRNEMGVSLAILIVIALILALLMHFAEHAVNPAYNYWDALIWIFVKFVDDPAEMVMAPVTLFGQIVGTLVGFVGIAIFAVPAGLIGSGFMDAMRESKRKKKLESYHKIMQRAFSAGVGKKLREYLVTLPKDEKAWYHGCDFGYIINNVSVAKFLIKGIELKDIIDVCKEYPEFRVKNEAAATSIEDGKEDRFMIEHFPVNRRYGFCVNRGSKVTIVATTSYSSLCIGNFSYYLAKFAGFNYISKDFDAADGESYYTNCWAEPFYEGITLQERLTQGEKITSEIRKAYKNKKSLRDEFLADLKGLCNEKGSWVICLQNNIQNQENAIDIHLSHSLKDGSCSTILIDKSKYDNLVASLQKNLQNEFQLSVADSTVFPLEKRGSYRNLLYKLQEDGCKCNGLVMRVSTQILEFDVRMRVVQFIMAKTIHDVIEPEHRLLPEEIADMNRTSRFYGFADQEIEKVKKEIFKMREKWQVM